MIARILTSPRVILALILVNGLGGWYGFLWYRQQLAATPWYLWPVVPDSPLSAVLFAVMLLVRYRSGRCPLLEAVACLLVFKFGAWAALIIGQHWLSGGVVVFEDVHLFISHLGMAVQGVVYAIVLRPPLPAMAAAVGVAVVNDLFDYGLGVHPRLQSPDLVPAARLYAVLLSSSGIWYMVWRKAVTRECSGG